MTPTVCLEITTLVTVLCAFGGFMLWFQKSTKASTEESVNITRSIDSLNVTMQEFRGTVAKVEGYFQNFQHTQAGHTAKIEDHSERIAWLETCVENDGTATPAMLKFQRHRRMGDSA